MLDKIKVKKLWSPFLGLRTAKVTAIEHHNVSIGGSSFCLLQMLLQNSVSYGGMLTHKNHMKVSFTFLINSDTRTIAENVND